jgi:hypothetical protein
MPPRKKATTSATPASVSQVPSTLERPADERPNAVDVDELPPLSEGERQDLIMSGATISPFNGQEIVASDFGLTPANDTARANEKRALERRAAAAAGVEPRAVSTADTSSTV